MMYRLKTEAKLAEKEAIEFSKMTSSSIFNFKESEQQEQSNQPRKYHISNVIEMLEKDGRIKRTNDINS